MEFTVSKMKEVTQFVTVEEKISVPSFIGADGKEYPQESFYRLLMVQEAAKAICKAQGYRGLMSLQSQYAAKTGATSWGERYDPAMCLCWSTFERFAFNWSSFQCATYKNICALLGFIP